jgi:hypothetical protein
MLVVLEGLSGSGKTLSAVALAIMEKENSGREIVSNIHLNGIEHRFITSEDLVKLIQDKSLNNCSVILDSMYIMTDCRQSQSSLVKLFTHFLCGCRRADIDVYITSNSYSDLDIRIRRAADIRGRCRYDIKKRVCNLKFIELHGAGVLTVKIDLSKFFKIVDGTKDPSCTSSNINRISENIANYKQVKTI